MPFLRRLTESVLGIRHTAYLNPTLLYGMDLLCIYNESACLVAIRKHGAKHIQKPGLHDAFFLPTKFIHFCSRPIFYSLKFTNWLSMKMAESENFVLVSCIVDFNDYKFH